MAFHNFKLTDCERDTLLKVLDHAVTHLTERSAGTSYVSDQWDRFAIGVARSKIVALRAKIFPVLRPIETKKP